MLLRGYGNAWYKAGLEADCARTIPLKLSPHHDDSVLSLYIAKRLDASRMRDISQHLDRCPRCKRHVKELSETTAERLEPPDTDDA